MSLSSFARRVKNAELSVKRTGGGLEGVTLKGWVADKVVRQGAAAGWGYAKGNLREKFTYKGVGYDAIVGGALVLAGAFLNAREDGSSKLGGLLDRVGDSGLQSYVNSYFCSLGTRAAKRVAVVVNQGKPTLPTKTAVVGMIAPAVAGPYLSASEMANFSQPRR